MNEPTWYVYSLILTPHLPMSGTEGLRMLRVGLAQDVGRVVRSLDAVMPWRVVKAYRVRVRGRDVGMELVRQLVSRVSVGQMQGNGWFTVRSEDMQELVRKWGRPLRAMTGQDWPWEGVDLTELRSRLNHGVANGLRPGLGHAVRQPGQEACRS